MNSAFHDKGGIGRKLKNKRKNQSQAMIKTVLETKVTYLRNYYRLERRDPDRTKKKNKGQFRRGTKLLQRFCFEEGRFLSFTNSRYRPLHLQSRFLRLGLKLEYIFEEEITYSPHQTPVPRPKNKRGWKERKKEKTKRKFDQQQSDKLNTSIAWEQVRCWGKREESPSESSEGYPRDKKERKAAKNLPSFPLFPFHFPPLSLRDFKPPFSKTESLFKGFYTNNKILTIRVTNKPSISSSEWVCAMAFTSQTDSFTFHTVIICDALGGDSYNRL